MPKKTSTRKNKNMSKKFDIPKNPNLIVHILKMKFSPSINDENYSETEIKKFYDIISSLSKSIWIDRTYVCYKGNRFKDAFIDEENWHKFCRLVIDDLQGKKLTKSQRNEITASLVAISSVYMYQMVEKYGYSTEDVDIVVKTGKFSTEYLLDNRKNWNF